jgi:hypothetical protein
MPHVIRLRGAWEVTSAVGLTIHTRNFGKPRTLESQERVWLVCQDVPGPAEVFLNGHKVAESGEAGSIAVGITEHLQPRNNLRFEVAARARLGEVSIEIRDA